MPLEEVNIVGHGQLVNWAWNTIKLLWLPEESVKRSLENALSSWGMAI
jgi:hypothetical protein